MADSKSLVQTVEFIELRRVFKKESDDIEKIDKEILNVLKDNNVIIRELIDKISLDKVSSGLGVTRNKSVRKSDEGSDQQYTIGTFKDFTEGFAQRLKEYKDFFTNAKPEETVEEAVEQVTDSSPAQADPSSVEQVTDSSPAQADPSLVELQRHTNIFEDLLGETVLLRKLSEGSVEFDKSLSGGKYRNTSGGEVTNLSTGNVSRQGGTLDFETVRSIKRPKRLLEAAAQKQAAPSFLLPSPASTNSSAGSPLLPTKLIDDIGNIRKAMLGDGINVKVINPEEVKSEGGGDGGTSIDVDVGGGGGGGKGKTGGKLSKFLGMAGKAAKVLGPAAAVAGAAYSGFQGYQNTSENFDLAPGQEATTGQKVSSTLGGVASGLTFGLLNEKTAAQGIQKAGEYVGEKATAAYEGVKDIGGKAVSAVGGFFGGIGDKVKNAFVKGTDEKVGVTQADQLVTSANSTSESSDQTSGGTLNKTNIQQGMSAQKTVLGSTFLGGLFSKKGITTGEFGGQSIKQSSLQAQDVGEHGNVSNLQQTEQKSLIGKRTATGLLGYDKYQVTDEKGASTDLTKGQYGKIQKLVESGKIDEAQKELQSIKDNRALNEEMSKIYGKTPEDTVTPLTEMSRDNEAMKRQQSQGVSAPPIVANTVNNSSTNTLAPIKASARNPSSSLERYQNRIAAYGT